MFRRSQLITGSLTKIPSRSAGGIGDGSAKTGSAGAIRDAGGTFGKMEVAREEEYFYRKELEKMQKLRTQLEAEIHQLEKQGKGKDNFTQEKKMKLAEMDIQENVIIE